MNTYNENMRYKPYSIVPVRTGWFGRTEFNILFEESPIRQTNMDYDSLKNMVDLLNSAYQIGYGTGHMHGEIDQLDKTNDALRQAATNEIKEAT